MFPSRNFAMYAIASINTNYARQPHKTTGKDTSNLLRRSVLTLLKKHYKIAQLILRAAAARASRPVLIA